MITLAPVLYTHRFQAGPIYDAPELSGIGLDTTLGVDGSGGVIDASVAFIGDGITYSLPGVLEVSLIEIESETGVITVDTQGPMDDLEVTIIVRATNSGGYVEKTFTITFDDVLPVLSNLAIDDEADPPVISFSLSRPGTVTGLVNNTASMAAGQIIAEYDAPTTETWAKIQYAAEAGVNSDSFDLSAVPEGPWHMHFAVEDQYERKSSQSLQLNISPSAAAAIVITAGVDSIIITCADDLTIAAGVDSIIVEHAP